MLKSPHRGRVLRAMGKARATPAVHDKKAIRIDLIRPAIVASNSIARS